MCWCFTDMSQTVCFCYEKEASNIILLKQVSQALGSYAMDRADIKQSLQVINHVAEDVKTERTS